MTRMNARAERFATTLLGVALALGAGACSRTSSEPKAEYWLCAKAGGLTMPDGVSVTIWGYALDREGFAGGCAAAPTLPGPTLSVPANDPTLTIHLRNLLPEPTSIVIPGLPAALAPVWWDGAGAGTTTRTSPSQRVRSFTAEAAPGGDATYTWSGVRPGTFLYHSGTHPQVQVQMGLSGAVTRDARDEQRLVHVKAAAYDGVEYDREVLLVFSEIDPDQHLAIANGTYGTAPAATSTLRYAPRYYLVNGRPFLASDGPFATVKGGDRTLLRLVNAGLQSYAPMVLGMHMNVIAEDGHPYRSGQKEQYSTLLPALKTMDALVVPPALGEATRYPIFDRRLNLTTGTAPDGGMLGHLAVSPP